MLTFSLFVAAVSVAALAMLASRLGRLRGILEEFLRRSGTLEKEADELRRANADLRQEQQFLVRFVREFPLLTRELDGSGRERQIPSILLSVVTRTLEPRRAVVLVRRRRIDGDSDRGNRLVVAAAAPEDAVKAGVEVVVGRGDMGLAALWRRVMSRQDFEADPEGRNESIPGFEPEFVAPMVFDDETLGLIAVASPGSRSDNVRAILRLIAQAGAQALHHAAAFTQMKINADLDGLTGVFNKRQMSQTLVDLVSTAGRTPLSLFMFDIDHFKNYNDVNGHVAGDRLLQALARRVQESIRKDDVFGRFGGEEFLLILPDTPLPQALVVADKIRGAIADHGFAFAERQPLRIVSVSGGVAQYPVDASDATNLLRAADDALYAAKRQGRNKVLAASPEYLRGSEMGRENADARDGNRTETS
jgi:diguanylate cyclase (GGDEF)-like protein